MATREQLAAGALARLRYLATIRRDTLNPVGLRLVGRAVVAMYAQARDAGAGDQAAAVVLAMSDRPTTRRRRR